MQAIGGWMFVAASSVAMASAQSQRDPLAPLPDQAPAQQQQAPASTPVRQQQSPYAPPAVVTYTAPTGFDAYKQHLMARARREGVRDATIRTYVPGLALDNRVIRLDRAQPGGPPNSNYIPPFAPYRRQHVSAELIGQGRRRYYDLQPWLRQIEARYGVDPGVLMAIYGHETSFGRVTGSFDLLQALASLAYEGRRRELFESEFVAALKLIDIGIPRWRLKGSYAGATGYPQFMPSVVLKLRADGDGDGYANIWASEADGLASIANYLRSAGWKPRTPWGVAVRVPPSLNRAALRSSLVPQRCPRVYQRHTRWLSMREWRSLGVAPIGRSLPDHEMATLIEPDGPNATAYLLTNNYRTILDYNCSNFYALAVGLLGDSIAGR